MSLAARCKRRSKKFLSDAANDFVASNSSTFKKGAGMGPEGS